MFRRLRGGLRLLALAALGLLVGCATIPDDNGESELPWSKPQPWEGMIPMPGFENR